jgi:hypothetical protein
MDTRWQRLALLLALALGGGQTMAIEKPQYTVIGSHGDVEYRHYAPYIVAETRIPGDWPASRAGNEGFRRLVAYISGNNDARGNIAMTAPVAQSRGEKIAMTAPVGQAAVGEDWVVTFVMPSSYSLEDLPSPRDTRIALKRIPARTVAVWRYAGNWGQRRYAQQEKRLVDALRAAGVSALSAPEFARYNAPFVPTFFRRNEILVTVDRVPDALAVDGRVALAR